MTNPTACRESFEKWWNENGEGMYDDDLKVWQAAWNTRAPGGEAMADELQGAFAECYTSDKGLAMLRDPECGISTVSRVKTHYSHIPLFTHPLTTSAEVERDAARYRWLRDDAHDEPFTGTLGAYQDWGDGSLGSIGGLSLDKAIDAALVKRGEETK